MAKLANGLKGKLAELSMAPFSDGRFEVIVDGKKIYSKLETGEFPDEDTLLKQAKRL